MIFDTIAAIATPFGNASIAVIRVSGDQAIEQINQIFKGKDLTKAKANTIWYGTIIDNNQEMIDEVTVSVFRAPKSFTKEDIIEITCHGGVLVTQKVLERVLELEIRLAEPGEFSKRAYLNGRIDLIQAESIMDIIHATNQNALKVASRSLQKETTKLITNLKEKLLTLIAKIEVNIDYPEYDDAQIMSKEIIYPEVISLIDEIDQILIHSRKTQILKEGVKTVIIGRPNVGKSSLLNALLDEDRAIVSDIPGTTRDTIDAYVNLAGITLHLIDTAGIRKTKSKIEKIGVSRSKNALSQAQLVLLVLDQSQKLTNDDKELLELTKNHQRIIIGNKADLPKTIELDQVLLISSLKKQGIKHLEEAILKELQLNDLKDEDFNYLSNVRHIQKLKEAKSALLLVIESIKNEYPIDIYAIDLTNAWNLLGEILGDHSYGDLLTELFSKFCLGK